MITGKGTKSGNTRSHSMRANKRTFKKNLITKVITIAGEKIKVKVSAKMYKRMRGFL